jgi:hypothetical protein
MPTTGQSVIVEVGLACGREAPMPHPAVGVHTLRRPDDLRDGKVDVVGVADARSDAAETSKCSMDLQASSYGLQARN